MKRKPRLIDYDFKLLEALSDLNDGIITFEKLNERFTTGGIMESLERLEANGVVSKGEGVEIRQGVYCNPSPSTVITGKPYEEMDDGYKRWLIHRFDINMPNPRRLRKMCVTSILLNIAVLALEVLRAFSLLP